MRYGYNTIDVHVDVELNQIIDSIIGNSDAQEIVECIQKLEKEFGDIDVTQQLYNYFKSELGIEDRDSKIQTSLLNCEEDYISTMNDLERKYGTSYIEKIEAPQEYSCIFIYKEDIVKDEIEYKYETIKGYNPQKDTRF